VGTIPDYPEQALPAPAGKNGHGGKTAVLLGAGALAAAAGLVHRLK
jgi:hypothetical protein